MKLPPTSRSPVAAAVIAGIDTRYLPETTEKREPYLHPYIASGDVTKVELKVLVRAFSVEKLHEQLQEQSIPLDRIVFASGSAGTQAGMLVGVKALGMETRVEGIDVSAVSELKAEIGELAPATAAHLGLDLEIDVAGLHALGDLHLGKRRADGGSDARLPAAGQTQSGNIAAR